MRILLMLLALERIPPKNTKVRLVLVPQLKE